MTSLALRIAAALGLMGRSTRTSIFGFLVFSLLGGVAMWFYWLTQLHEHLPAIGAGDAPAFLRQAPPLWILAPQIAAGLVFLWLAVRRLHDQDRPGWPALGPTALSLLPGLMPVDAVTALAGLADLVLLVFLFMPPTIGPNRYGPDPRGWRSLEHYEAERRKGRPR